MDISVIKADKELIIVNKIYSDVGNELIDYLKQHKNIYLEANPGYGKTFFIAQMGNAILNGETSYNRLIFCTPRLIIQEQIASDFKRVDFKLNGDSKMDEFNDSHKIITSTFDSLYLIADRLGEKDLIVIDEAHEILRNYHSTYNLSKNPYYEKTLQTLFHSGSSKILMSGTPTNNFHELLKLKHLRVIKKNESKVLINVDFTTLNPKELAYRYCEKYSEEYSADSLNIIYIKNKSDCTKIAYYLNSKGFNTRVLTSKTKTEDVYLNIAANGIVPKEIQFIITTNVISVGTNINNENVGGIAMINEYDPIEIKQFSKRFRNTTNLKIDIINKVVKRKAKSKKKLLYTHNLNKKITFKQIETQLELSKSFTDVELLFFKNMSYEKNDLSAPKYIINQALEKYLANESFLYRLYMNTFSTPSKLVKALNAFNDMEASISEINQSLYNDLDRKISKEARGLFKSNIESIIDDFINNKTSYIFYSVEILERHDIDKRNKLIGYIKKHSDTSKLELNDNLYNTVNSLLFKEYILEPLIEFLPYFNDLDLCLKFIKEFRPESRRKHILSIYVNNLIHAYCELEKNNFGSLLKIKSEILQDVNYKDKLFLDFIRIAFEFLSNRKSLHIHDLRKFLTYNNGAQGIMEKADKTVFPFNMIKDSYLNTSFLLGLVKGIFLLSPKKGIYNDLSGKPKKCFLFEQDVLKYNKNMVFENSIMIPTNPRLNNYKEVYFLKILNTPTDINRAIEV